jgi:hypothetical protein
VSQSGRSAEIVAARRAQAAGSGPSSVAPPWLAVTDDPGSPVARQADATLPLALTGDSNVRTIGYTCTLQALLLLRDALAGPGHAPAADWDELSAEFDRQVPAAERLAAALLGPLRGCAWFDLVGSGAQAGTAIQGALLLREVAKRPAAAYETYQYLHGPIEAAGAGLALLAIGGTREAKLARSLVGTGATVVLITALTPAELAAVGGPVPEGGPESGRPVEPGDAGVPAGRGRPASQGGGAALTGPASADGAISSVGAGGHPAAPVDAAGPADRLVAAGPGRPADSGAGSLTVFHVPARDDVALAVLGIVPLQTISGALADADGLPDGVFRFHQDDTKVTG